MLPLLWLGFASGLPLMLVTTTLQAWATVEAVSLQTIGLLTLVGVAYTLKPLWAPALDRYAPPWLGRRRGWMLLAQALLGLGLAAMSLFSPSQTMTALALLAVFVAWCSATQDVVFDAYRAEVLRPDERGPGAALSVAGYRLAMVVSGGLAIVLAERLLGWQNTYLLMGLLMLPLMLQTWRAPEPETQAAPPASLRDAVIGPLREFIQRPGAWGLLAFIVVYKLGDAFASALSTPFLIRGMGFSASTVGMANNVMGMLATVLGALAGASLLGRLGLYRALWLFGLAQALSNLGFVLLAAFPPHVGLMLAVVGLENLCAGLGTAAFVALLMGLCDGRYTATQFALLSALAAAARVYLAGPVSPPIIEAMGWANFFLLTAILALPGLWMLRSQRERIARIESGTPTC